MKNPGQTVKQTNQWLFALNIGFFAGLIWGIANVLLYYLGFTKVIPAYLAEPIIAHDTITSWKGHLIGLLFFILFSILTSLLYTLLFRKVKGPWLGIAYGLFWWAMLYVVVGPPLEMIKKLSELDRNSITSGVCLFILWGVFIGYTVALEFTDERQREPLTNFDPTGS